MAHITLKHGIEQAIRARIPEVGEILDTTDHASGSNPHYAPSGMSPADPTFGLDIL
jgi:Fe/S biogenesis protein NfuA